MLAIHLGEKDWVQRKGLELLKAMTPDSEGIRSSWAGSHILWTELVPCHRWRGADMPAAIDKARRKLNRQLRRFCRERGQGEWFTLILVLKWHSYLGVLACTRHQWVWHSNCYR